MANWKQLRNNKIIIKFNNLGDESCKYLGESFKNWSILEYNKLDLTFENGIGKSSFPYLANGFASWTMIIKNDYSIGSFDNLNFNMYCKMNTFLKKQFVQAKNVVNNINRIILNNRHTDNNFMKWRTYFLILQFDLMIGNYYENI